MSRTMPPNVPKRVEDICKAIDAVMEPRPYTHCPISHSRVFYIENETEGAVLTGVVKDAVHRFNFVWSAKDPGRMQWIGKSDDKVSAVRVFLSTERLHHLCFFINLAVCLREEEKAKRKRRKGK